MEGKFMRRDTTRHPLVDGNPPPWAGGWGEDDYGAWVELLLEQQDSFVCQRLRWIPPGTFWMGSPADEPGRLDKEGPRHLLTLSKGYWLFDTPVTQALWQAVMGTTPSKFQSLDRPVEKVSWQDCQEFLKQINSRIPGLELGLPSEAQWEYACRGGTDEALYSGGFEILGDGNAPALDAIAWYGGNSGVDFELEKGYDITYLENRQYDLNPSGTHPVGLKQPNAWGLYDMLGNVWEWCEDGQRQYSADLVSDPMGSLEPGAVRVIRGGSWLSRARICRCAYRDWSPPGDRVGSLGFRCARVQQ